ncbi:uncharacterized protein L201_007929 [Kwoniella dendrophila CBS 6074]|uniref:Uncharacterized protein n=1 Tax=Kwoniella dendrophila CBS 6074 TaxID=1295534 RepID=A0AAX4K5H6_9TREE
MNNPNPNPDPNPNQEEGTEPSVRTRYLLEDIIGDIQSNCSSNLEIGKATVMTSTVERTQGEKFIRELIDNYTASWKPLEYYGNRDSRFINSEGNIQVNFKVYSSTWLLRDRPREAYDFSFEFLNPVKTDLSKTKFGAPQRGTTDLLRQSGRFGETVADRIEEWKESEKKKELSGQSSQADVSGDTEGGISME